MRRKGCASCTEINGQLKLLRGLDTPMHRMCYPLHNDDKPSRLSADGNRWGYRDSTMILVAFRHGLRSSELVDLRWDQIDFARAVLHVRRAKKGTPGHPSRCRR